MNKMDRTISRATGNGGRGSGEESESSGGLLRGLSIFSLIVFAITFAIMYNLFPHFTQNVVFDGVIRNGWYIVPFVLLVYGMIRFGLRNKGDMIRGDLGKHRRPLSLFVFGGVVYLLWCAFVYTSTDYVLYHSYASSFTSRPGLIPSSPAFTRFTPRENACNDIANSISTTGEHVDCDYSAAMITPRGFAWVAPIVPRGVLNTFWNNNPGFMVLDDSAAADLDSAKRLTRIDDEQKVGPGMEWFDNLQYALAKNDFFSNYDTPHYLPLDDSKPDKLSLIVPKIKYGMFWRLPYWGGVVIVHSDGRLEDLTAEKAMADPRLKGKWIYPLALTRLYIQIQNYGLGWGPATPFVWIAGKLEIEHLQGNNQFPFVTQGNDGKPYLVTATKGQGSARGLYRMYFTDASTGVTTFHQFGTHEVVYGAGAAKERLTNIQGYQWYHSGDKGGNGVMIAVEPVYIVRPNDPTLYWKFTITNVNYSGISATAVANSARPDDIKVFPVRADYESWLKGNNVSPASAPAISAAGTSVRDEVLSKIEGMTRELNSLRGLVQSLPK